jgi:hypothetical protein
MKKNIVVGFVFYVLAINYVFAQLDTSLKTYSVVTKFDEGCSAGVTLTLFDKGVKKDSINQIILDRLVHGFYDPHKTVSLKNLYANKSFDPTDEFTFTVFGGCTYHKNNIFSFVSCAYNACDKALRSNYEAITINMDMKTGKELSLSDIIDPAKRDSFEKYVYALVTRYYIKNLPTCYVAGYSPIQVKGSNNISIQGDSVTYFKGLTDKFYFRENNLFVYNRVKRRLYDYNSVEVTLPLFNSSYFFRKEMLPRFGFK